MFSGSRLAEAVTALRFLTRLPVPGPGDHAPDALVRSVWAFPIAGLVVGGLSAMSLWITAAVFQVHPIASALIAIAVAAWASGALHEDGLSDTVDGFGGGRDREAKLRIMRDSRIGAFGVLALIIIIGLRAAALASFLGPGLAAAGMMIACCLSRAVIPIVMAALPAVQTDGLSKAAGRPQTGACCAAAVIAGAAAIMIGGPSAALWPVLSALIGAAGVAVLARSQIGGQTGDVLGAVEQVAQTCALFALTGVLVP